MIDPAIVVLGAGIASFVTVVLRARIGRGVSSLLDRLELGADECLRVEGECIVAVVVDDAQCLVQGGRLVEHIVSQRSVSGVVLSKVTLDRGKVLSELENRIVSLRIVLEREPLNKSIERKVKILESIYSSVLNGESPVAASLAILVAGRSLEEARSSAEDVAREIRTTTTCKTRIVVDPKGVISAILPRHRLQKREPIPARVVAKEVEEGVSSIASTPLDGVYVGVRKSDRTPFMLPLWRPSGAVHTLILGPTGRGKTTLASILALRASSMDVFTVVVDPKGDAVIYLSGYMTVVRVEASQALSYTLWLYREGVASTSFMQRVLRELGLEDGLDDVLEAVEANEEIGGRLRGRAYLRAVRLGVANAKPLKPVMEESVVLDASSLPETLKSSVMVAVAFTMLQGGGRKLLVVDEAWRMKGLGRAYLVKLLKEARSRNLALVLITQDPGDMPDEVYNNVGNFVVFGSNDDVYVESVSRVLRLEKRVAKLIRELGVGEAVVQYPGAHKAEIIEVDSRPLRLNVTG